MKLYKTGYLVNKEQATLADLKEALKEYGMVAVPSELLERCYDRLEFFTDEGPCDEGWKSRQLIDDLEAIAEVINRE